MSVLYLSAPKNFKNDLIGGQYRPRTVGSSDYAISKILEHVITQLFASQLATTKSSLLCLVNAWATDNRMSVGFSNNPDSALWLPNCGIIFTFSIRPRPVKTLPDPTFLLGRSRYWRVWGRDGTNEYISVGVPRSLLFGLDGNGIDLLNVLYNAVGVTTRNHMQTFKTQRIVPNTITQDVSTLESLFHGKNVRDAGRYVPYSEWQYVLSMWKNHSNWFIPQFFDQTFPLYYVMYLNEWIYSPDLNQVAKKYVDTTVTDYVAKGLLAFSTSLSLKIPPSGDEIVAAMYLLLADKDLSELEDGQVSRTNFIRRFYRNLATAMETPEFSALVVKYSMTNHYTMARDLLMGYFNNQLKNLIACLDMVEV